MKVPEYTERVETVTPETRATTMPRVAMPGVVPGAFGEDTGRAMENLGKAGEKIAQHIYQMAIDEQDKEVLRRETSYRQDLQNNLFDESDETIQINGQDVTRKKGMLLRQLGQAKGATEELDKIYQKQLRNKYLGGLTKYQADKLGPALDNYFLSIRNNVITHESNQLDEDFKNATESNLKQKILDASTIRDEKQLGLAIEDAIASAAPYYKKYDETTTKILNTKIAEDILSATVDNTPDFQTADRLLLSVKDKIPKDFYNEKRNELINHFKKIEKESELAIIEAKNKREEELFTQSILTPGSITKNSLAVDLENKNISPQFYMAMVKNLESIKKINAQSNSSTFNTLTDYILNDENKPEEIRIKLLNENAKGEITDDELKILNTFNQNITKDTIDKAFPKKNFLQAISFWSDEYAQQRQETKAQMFKDYMQRVINGEEPQVALDKIIRNQIKNDVIQAASNIATKNTKIEDKIKQLQKDGWDNDKIKKALQEKDIDPSIYGL